MSAAGLVAVVVGVLLLCVAVSVAWLAIRRVRLMRGGGVDLCLRRRFLVNDWHFGVGRFSGDEFAWYRLTSFRIGPTVVLNRSALQIVHRRAPLRSEDFAIPSAVAVLRCRPGPYGSDAADGSGGAEAADGAGRVDDAGAVDGDVELAMSADVLTGFMAWIEATPPGRGGYPRAS